MSIAQVVDKETSIDNNEDGNQFLSFFMADEEYGIDILRVQEIRGWDSVTKIPNTPDYIKGVINIRGTIVPIIDLRLKFKTDSAIYDKTTVVIVVGVKTDGKTRTMGMVVDAVSDVYSITQEQIKEAPNFGSVVKTEFVQGLATIDEKMLILLEIDMLLNSDDLSVINTAEKTD